MMLGLKMLFWDIIEYINDQVKYNVETYYLEANYYRSFSGSITTWVDSGKE